MVFPDGKSMASSFLKQAVKLTKINNTKTRFFTELDIYIKLDKERTPNRYWHRSASSIVKRI